MLRAYGPECDGSILDPHHGPIPPSATWIDLEEPTHEEEKLVEQAVELETGVDDLFVDVPEDARLDGPIAGLPLHASEMAVEREKVQAQKRNGPAFFFDMSS